MSIQVSHPDLVNQRWMACVACASAHEYEMKIILHSARLAYWRENTPRHRFPDLLSRSVHTRVLRKRPSSDAYSASAPLSPIESKKLVETCTRQPPGTSIALVLRIHPSPVALNKSLKRSGRPKMLTFPFRSLVFVTSGGRPVVASKNFWTSVCTKSLGV